MPVVKALQSQDRMDVEDAADRGQVWGANMILYSMIHESFRIVCVLKRMERRKHRTWARVRVTSDRRECLRSCVRVERVKSPRDHR